MLENRALLTADLINNANNALDDHELNWRAFTQTEVVAAIADPDPLAKLAEALADESLQALAGMIDWNESKELLRVDGTAVIQIGLIEGADPLAAVEALEALALSEWAAPNLIYSDETNADPRELIPNDPQYGSQYHHPLMQNDLAWDTTLGSPSVIVAVTDDGVSLAHVDLAANIWINDDPVNLVDDDGNGFVDDVNGWDFISNDNNPNPNGSDAHGTHVSGIAAARTNNLLGVAGTAGGATIMPIKFYNGATPSAWTSTVILNSYKYAVDNGAKIISTSYNVDGFVNDPTFVSALNYIYSNGALHLNSAGNNNQLNPLRQALDQSLYVASSDALDLKSSFSNYGFGIDITAPGSSILSTLPGNAYGLNSGTSMATPNAAGVAALIWSAHPSWTRDQVAAQFIGTADSIDTINPAYAGLLGSGRVNSYRGVLETLDPPRIEGVPGLPAEGGTAITPITSFGVDLANVLDATTVVLSNFELRGDGVDNAFDTPDDVILPLALPTGFTYRVGSNRLTLSTSGMGTDRYRFRALSDGLRDPFGSALDGNGDGVAGDHFERTFSFIVPATISGQKFYDVNRNAMKDAGEPGLPGWNIYLDLNNNGVLEGGAVEPDSFAAGTVLNTIIPQATLHAIGSTGADLAPNTVLSSTGAFASTGTRVFGSSVGGTIWTDDDFRLRIDFTAPVSSVSIDAISDDTLDVGRLEIYNSSNVLLATVITSELVGAGQFATMTANRPLADIAYAIASGHNGQFLLLDNLHFGSEPSRLTDASGNYSFINVEPGTYTVREVQKTGWVQMAPAGGFHTVTVASSELADGVDFGNRSLQVTSTAPPFPGGVFTLPAPFTYDVNFTEPIEVASVDTGDLVLSQGTVTGAIALDADTARYTISGITTEGSVTITIPQGAVNDAFGNPNPLPFSASYIVDLGTAPYPVPLTPKNPLGSLIYDPSVSATINFVNDIDIFSVNVDSNQDITVLVTPTSGALRPSIALRSPTGTLLSSTTATAAGQNAVLQTITAATGGVYTIEVGGAGTTGNYTVQLTLNAALEREGNIVGVTNNTTATTQDINTSFVTFSTPQATAQRAAVLGSTDFGYSASNVPFSFTDIAGTIGSTIRLSSGNDVSTGGIGIGFNFSFLGTTSSTLFISSNGLITFGSATSSPLNATLNLNPTQAAIAPFWDDLNITNSTGTARVWTKLVGAAPNRQFIIQWDKVTFAAGGSTTDPITFQAVLSETSNNIQFNYLDLVSGTAAGNNGASATVGVKRANPTGASFLELGNNTAPPNPFVGTLVSTLLTPVLPPDHYSFTLNNGETATLAVTGLGAGNLNVDLLNPSGAVIATGISGPTNLTKVISNFAVTATGTYFARVSGAGNVPYSAVITRNAALDAEANNTFSTAQSLGANVAALGHVTGGSGANFFDLTGPTVTGPVILSGSKITLGFNTDGSFITAGTGSTGIRYNGIEFVALGTPIASFTVGFNGLTFTNNGGTSAPQIIGVTRQDISSGTMKGLRIVGTAGGSVRVERVVLFNQNDDFATVATRLTNLSGVALANVATLENVDPDQVSFSTINDVVLGGQYVRASASSGLTIGLGSADPRSVVSAEGFDNRNPFLIINSPADPNGASGDIAIAQAFNFGALGVGGQVSAIAIIAMGTTAAAAEATFSSNSAGTLLANEDWYSFNVTSTANPFRLETRTPADGPGEFANTLNPKIELHDPSGALVASGTTLPDGRNEFIQYQALVTGSYRVRITGESNTSGEYFLIKDFIAPHVVSTSIVPGDIKSGNITMVVTFSEPMKVSNLSTDDFSMRGNFRATNFGVINPAAFNADGTVLTLNYGGLPDDSHTFTLFSGANGGANFTDTEGVALDGDFSGVFPSGNGLAGGNFVMGFFVDVPTIGYTTPLEADPPIGSLVYDPILTRVIAFSGDTDTYTLNVDPNQKISVLVSQPTGALRASVELRNPSNTLLASATAATAGQPVFLNSVTAATSGTYQITVSGAGGTVGRYVIQVILNAAVEEETNGGDSNDTLPDAEDLDATNMNLGFRASRLAVLGSTGVMPIVKLENFESGLPPSFTTASFNSTGAPDPSGRIRAFAPGGTGNTSALALIMDRDSLGSLVLNEAIYTVDLSGLTQATLSFSHISFSDEAHPLPPPPAPPLDFTGHANGDGVAISDDGVRWRTILSAPTNTAWTNFSIDLAAAAAAAGMTLGPDFRIKFQQFDDQPIPTDGRGYDNIQILVPDVADLYRFTLTAGEKATVAVAGLAGGNLDVELLSDSGAPLATGVDGAANLTKVISNFGPTAGGTFYARVTGGINVPYNLLVTRNAAFDTEGNDTFDTATPMDGTTGALGAIHSGVVPSSLATVEGNSFSSSPFNIGTGNTMRYQQLYARAEFSQGGEITAIHFRRNANPTTLPFTTSGINVKINLGYAANFAAPSSTFANNIGPGTTTVYDSDIDGLLTLSSPTPNTSPNPFEIVINLSQPFHYDPHQGDLLLDIFMRSGPTTAPFDLSTAGQQTATKRITSAISPTGVNATTGGIDTTSGLVTRFDMDVLKEDWYSFNVTDTDNILWLSTITPAEGPNQFVNNFNPKIELYSPSDPLNPVASGTPLTSGNRNEFIQYHPLVTGNYRVRVTGENNTAGDYFLAKNFRPAPSVTVSPIDENDTATLTGTINDPDVLDSHTVVITWGPGEGSTTLNIPAGVNTFTASHQYLDDNPTGTPSDSYPISVVVTDNLGGPSNAAVVAGSAVALINLDGDISDTEFNSAVTNTIPAITASYLHFATTGTAHSHGSPVEVFVEIHNPVTNTWTEIYRQTIASGGQLSFNGLELHFPPQPVDQARLNSTPSQTHTYHNWATHVLALGMPSPVLIVNNVAPDVVPIAGPGAGVPGQVLSFSSIFTDVGPLDTHTVTWNFGDGTGDFGPASASPGAINATHMFTATGTYTVTVKVQDDDLGVTIVTTTVTIVAVGLHTDPCDPDLTALFIGGTTGDDTIEIDPGADGAIEVTFNGVLLGSFAPTGHVIAYGQAGDDNIQVAGSISLPVWLYGDDGNDRLNAGNGGSLLLGGNGNDELHGGGGRDVLIGGEGADKIVANSNDDILIAGYTTNDDRTAPGHDEFWCDVLEEWNSTNSSAVRVQNLRDGTGGNAHNGASLLLPAVRDDLCADAIDFLNGSSGDDWLIYSDDEDKVSGQTEATDPPAG